MPPYRNVDLLTSHPAPRLQIPTGTLPLMLNPVSLLPLKNNITTVKILITVRYYSNMNPEVKAILINGISEIKIIPTKSDLMGLAGI